MDDSADDIQDTGAPGADAPPRRDVTVAIGPTGRPGPNSGKFSAQQNPAKSGKVPGSGRKRGTPNKLTRGSREHILKHSSPLDFLIKIMEGKPVLAANDDDARKRSEVYPSYADRVKAAEILARKVAPDLKASEISGPSGVPLSAPAPDIGNRELGRRLALIWASAGQEVIIPAEHSETSSASVSEVGLGGEHASIEAPSPSGPPIIESAVFRSFPADEPGAGVRSASPVPGENTPKRGLGAHEAPTLYSRSVPKEERISTWRPLPEVVRGHSAKRRK